MDRLKRDREDRLKRLRIQIQAKNRVLLEKRQRVQEIRGNLAKVDKYAGEKGCEGKYYQEVFKAFKKKLIEEEDESASHL